MAPQPLTFGRLDKRKLLWGVVIVLGISISWVGATQATKSTYSGGFEATFFLVWFSTCWMIVCFPLYVLKERLIYKTPVRDLLRNSLQIWRSDKRSFLSLATFASVACLVMPFCLLWIATNYMYAKALALPQFAPADVTALFSSAPAFVFVLSTIVLKDKITVLKLFAVPMAITGVVLFQYAEGFSAVSIVGSLLSVGAAIGAATYKTMFKKCVGDASLGEVALFLSTLGLLNAFFLWFIFVVLSTTGAESLEKASIPWSFLCTSAILSLLFNFLINFGIAYTYPLFISLGTVVGIPLNAAADQVFRNITFDIIKIEGSLFIIVGFLLLLLPDQISEAVDSGFMTMLCLNGGCSCRPRTKEFRVTAESSLVTNEEQTEHNLFG